MQRQCCAAQKGSPTLCPGTGAPHPPGSWVLGQLAQQLHTATGHQRIHVLLLLGVVQQGAGKHSPLPLEAVKHADDVAPGHSLARPCPPMAAFLESLNVNGAAVGPTPRSDAPKCGSSALISMKLKSLALAASTAVLVAPCFACCSPFYSIWWPGRCLSSQFTQLDHQSSLPGVVARCRRKRHPTPLPSLTAPAWWRSRPTTGDCTGACACPTASTAC